MPTETHTATPTETHTATPTETHTATPTETHTSTPTPGGGAGFALQFDGVDDFVRLAETTNIMGSGSGWQTNKTVSLWVRPLGTSTTCAAAMVCDSVFSDLPLWWGISRGIVSGNDRLWVWNWDGNHDAIAIPYTIGEWTHITLLHSGGVLRAFKNGVEVGNTPSGPTGQPPPPAFPVLQIGGVITGQNWSFEGQIDEVNVWNIARTPADILQDVYHIYAGNETGLVAYYRMSDGAGTSLTDDSVATWTGTLFNGTGVVGHGPLWVPSGAFDGQ